MLLAALPESTGSARKIGNANAPENMGAPVITPTGMPIDTIAILRNADAYGLRIMSGKKDIFLSILSIGTDARW